RAWLDQSLVEFSGMLSVLLKREFQLGEALGMVARSATDPAIRAASIGMAAEIERGRDLTQAMAARSLVPRTLVYLVHCGQSHGALAGAFHSAHQMYSDRFDQQLRLTRLVLPPLVFVIVFGTSWLVLFTIVTPVIKLISDLS